MYTRAASVEVHAITLHAPILNQRGNRVDESVSRSCCCLADLLPYFHIGVLLGLSCGRHKYGGLEKDLGPTGADRVIEKLIQQLIGKYLSFFSVVLSATRGQFKM